MSKPVVKVLYAPGTNSHQETLWVFERVGAKAELLYLSDVLAGNARLDDGDALCIAGGFANGDHTGAGNIAGKIMRHKLGDQLAAARRKPIIGVCNGFQIAVRAGLFGDGVSLTVNQSGTFLDNRYQQHVVSSAQNVWTKGMEGQTLRFPCAHGEGRFVYESNDEWDVALTYPEGQNPDGSADDIAGISTKDGLVLGLMDHPERLPEEPGNLDLFANGVAACH